MICYKDMTFCVSPECTNKCGRKLTDEIRAAAKRWWKGDGAPIATAYFCDTPEPTHESRVPAPDPEARREKEERGGAI